MAIGVVPGSAKLVLLVRPRAKPPEVLGTEDVVLPQMSFATTPIIVRGEVMLTGAPGDEWLVADWTLGFIQAIWSQTTWFSYRGQYNRDGSVFLQLGKPPALPQQACRDVAIDSDVRDVFTSTKTDIARARLGATLPVKLSQLFADEPSNHVNLSEPNRRTGKRNYLHEVQIETHFCTVLSLKDRSRVFHHLFHFYWNVRWQARFRPLSFANAFPNFRIEVVSSGTGEAVGPVLIGAPTDLRFKGVLTSPQHFSCNEMWRMAVSNVDAPSSPNRHESATWRDFDVRRP